MASGNKKRGPKPRPGTPAKRRGLSMQWWIVIGVVVVAAIVGIAVQSSRSKTENTKVVTPTRGLGPNDSEIEGRASAPVTVQEYADFQCPSCKQFHDRMQPTINQLVADGKIRFAYSYFPFIGDESVRAAAAAVCAGDQGRFFPYADVLYTNQPAENSGFLTNAQLIEFGPDAGIAGSKLDAFEECVQSNRYEGFVRQKADEASKRGINSTPTVLVNGKQLTGEQTFDPAAFEQAVADAAAAKS